MGVKCVACAAPPAAPSPGQRSRRATSSLRPTLAGSGRHAGRAQPRLPPRHGRAGGRAVRGAPCRRHGRRHRAAYGRKACRAVRGVALRPPRRSGAQRRSPAPRTRGGKRTLWGALTGRSAALRSAADRQQREAKALLSEDFSGIACSDRWWANDYLDVARRQVCWAHLTRGFTAHAEGLAAPEAVREGRPCGASPACPAWSRPTTPPSVGCAGRSSTASSRLAASRRRVSEPSSGSSRPRSPAVGEAAHSTGPASSRGRRPDEGRARRVRTCRAGSCGEMRPCLAICRGRWLSRPWSFRPG